MSLAYRKQAHGFQTIDRRDPAKRIDRAGAQSPSSDDKAGDDLQAVGAPDGMKLLTGSW